MLVTSDVQDTPVRCMTFSMLLPMIKGFLPWRWIKEVNKLLKKKLLIA